jgi:hypothetical protein
MDKLGANKDATDDNNKSDQVFKPPAHFVKVTAEFNSSAYCAN